MDPVQAQVDAFNARDLEAFIACYAPNVVIEGPDGAAMMHGHEQMHAMYGQLFAQSPALHVEVPTRIRVGTSWSTRSGRAGSCSRASRASCTRRW